jgi:hypothetical protein
MSDEYIALDSLPDDFQKVVMREFVPYSVAIARVSSENHSTFVPLGAGTLVNRDGRIGILTARHCLKACSPQVQVGPCGKDTLLLILRDARSVRLHPEEMFEHELATPSSEEYGPDLAFLEISPCERLQTILAIASVWSLDRDPDEILKVFGGLKSMLAAVGFPEVRCETRIEGNHFHRISYHLTRTHVIEEGDITQRDGWDYIDSKCVYSSSSSLPRSFEGCSGGGIWSMEVKRNKSDSKLTIGRSALVGVSFYQTPLNNGVRHVRGHFVKSIYDLAWRNFGRPAAA